MGFVRSAIVLISAGSSELLIDSRVVSERREGEGRERERARKVWIWILSSHLSFSECWLYGVPKGEGAENFVVSPIPFLV